MESFALHLISKNVNIKIYRTIILPVVLCGCETWSLILREERRLRVFESRVLRRIFGIKRDEVTGDWRKLRVELNDLYLANIIRVIKSRRTRWAERIARRGRGVVHTGFWWGNLTERGHFEDRGVDGRLILRCIFRKWDGRRGLR
jgi:hypothetical protein